MIYNSILDTIGNTPILRVRRLLRDVQHEVYLKLENCNPSLSIKDRAALSIIEHAERAGLLKLGDTIIESTSGNFGKALAMIGAARGYRVIIVVDPKISSSTLAFYKAFGAEIDLVNAPDEDGNFQKRRLKRVQELLATMPDAYWPNQYDNPYNPEVHARTTSREILADFEHLDVFVASVSTGGHLSGTARTLKAHLPNLEVVAVDAVGSAIFGSSYRPYLMNGIGLSWLPRNLDMDHINHVQLVSDRDAFSTCRVAAQHEGLLLGGSAGAVLFACLCAVERSPTPQRVLGIVPDSGMNYFDNLFNDEWLCQHQIDVFSHIDHLHRAVEVAVPHILSLV